MKIMTYASVPAVANMVKGAFSHQGVKGHEFVHAADRVNAEAGATGVDVIIVDWESDPPGVCAALIRAVKQKKPTVRVVILCPRALEGTTAVGRKAGASEMTVKPIDPVALVKAVMETENTASAAAAVGTTVNVEFINPFVDGCKRVFSTMCQMEIERKRLYLQDDHKMFGDVSGVMGLSGAASGSVVVSLPSEMACLAVANMLGESPKSEVDQDICDGVGEIINMISGHAKAAMVKTRYHFTISIPSVVIGKGHEIAHKRGIPSIVVIFEGAGHEFALQVCMEPSKE